MSSWEHFGAFPGHDCTLCVVVPRRHTGVELDSSALFSRCSGALILFGVLLCSSAVPHLK